MISKSCICVNNNKMTTIKRFDDHSGEKPQTGIKQSTVCACACAYFSLFRSKSQHQNKFSNMLFLLRKRTSSECWFIIIITIYEIGHIIPISNVIIKYIHWGVDTLQTITSIWMFSTISEKCYRFFSSFLRKNQTTALGSIICGSQSLCYHSIP